MYGIYGLLDFLAFGRSVTEARTAWHPAQAGRSLLRGAAIPDTQRHVS
jgi:hypothetical protein